MISLISHLSKVMLKTILNRQVEKIIAEEQAGFRAGRSTTDQIFNLRIHCEKYLQHQQRPLPCCHRLQEGLRQGWHAALWAMMEKYNISTNLTRVIRNLHDKATSAVLFNSSRGDWFQTTAGVRQECLLSPTHFNIFLERIMTDALEDHEGTVSIGGRTITSLCFADDIDGLAGEEELAKLVEHLDKASIAYSMEISAKKTKLMTNTISSIKKKKKKSKVNGQKLVTSFKYLGSVITDEGSKPEIPSRIAQATAALTRLKPVWSDRSISLRSTIRLMRSLVTAIFLCACESWTLTAELQRRIQAMEMRCYRKLLHISHKGHVINEEVHTKIQQAIRPHEDL